jgi:hypothetical protein
MRRKPLAPQDGATDRIDERSLGAALVDLVPREEACLSATRHRGIVPTQLVVVDDDHFAKLAIPLRGCLLLQPRLPPRRGERQLEALDVVRAVSFERVRDEYVGARYGNAGRSGAGRLAFGSAIGGGEDLSSLGDELRVEVSQEYVVAVFVRRLPRDPKAARIRRLIQRRPEHA